MEKLYIRDGRAPVPLNEVVSRVMSANKASNTVPELLLRKSLRAEGVMGYRLHWKKVPGRPDIAFIGKRVAVFVHGCYWHRCPYCKPHFPKSNQDFWSKKFEANKERDQKKTTMLNEQGWQVLTLWECQIKKDPQTEVKKIQNALQKNLPS